MKKYNLHNIMNQAWKFVRKCHMTMAQALRIAWANAKKIANAIATSGITEAVHTWYSWTELGREVIHESKAMFQVIVDAPDKKKGTQILSYFGESQTCALGSQD